MSDEITNWIRTMATTPDRYLWWPIRLRLHFSGPRMSVSCFAGHGWQVGVERNETLPWPYRRVFGQTWHAFWGRVQVQMGHGRDTEFAIDRPGETP